MGRTRIADGVHRLGSSLVNFYLVEQDGRYTVVDAALPGYWDQVPAALESLGARLADVEAVVLTHAHPDHVGLAERLRTEAQARVFVHEADAQMARTAKAPAPTGIVRYLWRPTTWRLFAHFAANGLRTPRVADVTTYKDGDTLDVPGGLRVVATPGHTYGHSALLLDGAGVLFTGDALCGTNPLTGRDGPQIMPSAFNTSNEQALASLERLEGIDASHVLFGHGEPWTGGVAAAVARARELGPS
jgi:glyoxylase-like metal-dependent hydrolase (beta-lactamase superfamily II)